MEKEYRITKIDLEESIGNEIIAQHGSIISQQDKESQANAWWNKNFSILKNGKYELTYWQKGNNYGKRIWRKEIKIE